MIFRLFSILLIFTVSTIVSFADEASDKAEFKRLYAEFNDLYANSEEIEPIIEIAQKLYELAPKTYGRNHQNTAVVTYNLASLTLEKAKEINNRDEFTRSATLFKGYFDILDDIDAPKNKDYVFQYIQYIDAMSSEGKSRILKRHTSKVRKIARTLDYDKAALGDIEFSLGYHLFVDNEILDALDYFEKAQDNFNEAYGSEHIRTGESAFWVAKIKMAQNKRKASERNFLAALNAFEKNGKNGENLKQNTHAFLVALYEDMGQSDKATLHCRAVAEERTKNFDRYIKPLYRKNPVFPDVSTAQINKMKKENVNVLMEFDVDVNGFTKNIRIIESDNEKFNKNSIKAAEGYRYAPQIENGEIVETKGAKVMISYRVAR